MLSRAFITGRLFGVGCCLHDAGGWEWWVCAFWFGGSALLKPGAQVDVDGFSQRHSTLRSRVCGQNVVALSFSSGDCFTFE
jgi:hypothetical protein